MIKQLQMRLTGLGVIVSAMILAAMSLLCLHISEKNMEQNEYHAFENTIYTIISYLEDQSVISHEWALRMESSHSLALWFYDNGRPLLINSLPSSHKKRPEEDTALADRIISEAAAKKGIQILSSNTSYTLPQHATFSFTDQNSRYYAAALLIPRENACLGVAVLHPLTAHSAQIHRQRREFLAAALLALAALTAFFWFFTGIMLRPVEESQKKQARFVAAASHELRAPLAVILSSASCLQQMLGEKASSRDYADAPASPAAPSEKAPFHPERFLHAILSESRRMNRLVRDMLQLANMDARPLRLNPENTPVKNTSPWRLKKGSAWLYLCRKTPFPTVSATGSVSCSAWPY